MCFDPMTNRIRLIGVIHTFFPSGEQFPALRSNMIVNPQVPSDKRHVDLPKSSMRRTEEAPTTMNAIGREKKNDLGA